MNGDTVGSHVTDGKNTLFVVCVRWFVSEVTTVLSLERDCHVFNFSVNSCVNKPVLINGQRVALLVKVCW